MPQPPDPAHTAADEQRLAALLRAVEAPAPAGLRQRVAELASAPGPLRRRRRRRPLLGLAAGFAAAIVLALVLSAGTPRPPSVLRVSQVALERAIAPAPRPLVAAGTSIVFPQWSGRGWPSRGTRSDSLDGRTVTTEFYSSYENGTLGYAIVSGAPLRWGSGARAVMRAGTRYRLISSGGVQIVAWVQDGHTCVLASRSAAAATLLELAVAQDGSTPA